MPNCKKAAYYSKKFPEYYFGTGLCSLGSLHSGAFLEIEAGAAVLKSTEKNGVARFYALAFIAAGLLHV